MKHLGIVKADTLVAVINWIGIPLIFLYAISMFLAPWFEVQSDWIYVQKVWDRWQTLNTGMLAFISSVIAFNIAKFNSNKQRERRFIAARAFLPHALSALTSYFKSSSRLMLEAWERLGDPGLDRSRPLEANFPELPEEYKETFSRCIADAEPDVGDYLAYILMRLQVHHSRLRELNDSFSEGNRSVLVRENIKSYMYRLGELQALTNRLFDFARGFESFGGSDLDWDDYSNAYSNLDIWPEDIDDLEGFTQRAIARSKSNIDA